MMKPINYLTATAIILGISACAPAVRPAAINPQESIEARERAQAAEDLQQRLTAVRKSYIAGDYRETIRGYEEIFAHYASPNGEIECHLRTNLAISYLETGNLNGFRRTAGQLVSDCKGKRFLGTETQVVLKLYQVTTEGSGTDDRIDSRIETVINSIREAK